MKDTDILERVWYGIENALNNLGKGLPVSSRAVQEIINNSDSELAKRVIGTYPSMYSGIM